MRYSDFIVEAERLAGELAESQREQFLALQDLYVEWNGKVNVISRRDINNLYSHHVLHSLMLAAYMKTELPEDFALAAGAGAVDGVGNVTGENAVGGGEVGGVVRERLRFLDVGTGGGFPGIPLAIVFPNAHFTLCDSVAKKTRVVADIAERLGLKNVKVVTARAEELTDTYNYIVSRATASLSDLLRWTLGRFDRGLLCLKGGDVVGEIAEAVRKFRLAPSSMHVWSIENQLKDEYFRGKHVIFYKNFCK